ncbi:MAG: hypothetical protein IKC53_04070 [Lentisphaeria bacterium]|nr:hypothetical protein [Lentisphaeria bacterium]
MNAYQLWLRLTYWFRATPELFIFTTIPDIAAVTVLLFILKRFPEMKKPLLAIFVLILFRAILLPWTFTNDMTGQFLIYLPFSVVWMPSMIICFMTCQYVAPARDRGILLCARILGIIYLLIHLFPILFVLGSR